MGVRTFGIDGQTNSSQDFRLTDIGLFVPASALNVRTGVTVVPTLTGTGSLSCQVSPFSAVIDGTSNSLQGGYRVTLDAAATVNITTGSAQSRIDLIALQIQDNTFDSSGQHQGVVVYVAGTPGSGSAPATPVNSIGLFTIAVPASATSLNFATAQIAVFPFTAAAGGIVPVRNNNDKPAVACAVQYRHRLDVAGTAGTASPLEWSTDGTTWRPVFDTSAVPASTTAAITAAVNAATSYGAWTNTTIISPYVNYNQPQYRTAPGNKVELRGSVSAGSSTSAGAGVIGGLPAPSRNLVLPLACGSQTVYLQLNSGQTLAVEQSSIDVAVGVILGFDGLCYSL
jgi:hypothetical protein